MKKTIIPVTFIIKSFSQIILTKLIVFYSLKFYLILIGLIFNMKNNYLNNIILFLFVMFSFFSIEASRKSFAIEEVGKKPIIKIEKEEENKKILFLRQEQENEENELSKLFNEISEDDNNNNNVDCNVPSEEEFSNTNNTQSNFNEDETETEIDTTIQIMIDSFPKKFIEENGSRGNSGVHEKYWVDQKETIKKIIKSLKKGKTICVNEKEYFLNTEENDRGLAIHTILGEIYGYNIRKKNERRNMVNALKRLGLKQQTKSRKKRTKEEIKKIAEERKKGATFEEIEKMHHIDSRTLKSITKKNEIEINLKRKIPEKKTQIVWDERAEENLKNLIHEGKSDIKIAEELGTTRDEIKRKRDILIRNLSKNRKPLSWDENMENTLLTMKNDGTSNEEIANFFTINYGEITKNAIATKICKLKKKRKLKK